MRAVRGVMGGAGRVVLVELMVLVWTGVVAPGRWVRGADAAAPAAASAPETDAWGPAEAKRTAAALERVYRAIEAERAATPRDRFDVKAVAAAVGREAEKAFAWVRDQTRWVPYRGVLRGPTGVVMDRRGNSVDRALLLAELLRLGGHQVRLASGELPAGMVETTLAKLSQAPAPAATGEAPRARAALPEAEAQRLEAVARQLELRGNRSAEEVAARMAQQVPALSQAVEAALKGAKGDDAARDAAALREHWWVQWSDDGQTWRDADPLLPDARFGEVTGGVTAAKTVAAQADGRLPLPEEMYHAVRVRVVAERRAGEGVTEVVPLEHTFRTAETYGRRVQLIHQPVDWPGDSKWMAEPDAREKFVAAANGVKEWVPLLLLGPSDRDLQQGVRDTGELDPKPKLDPIAKLGGGIAGAAGKLNDILGDAGADNAGAKASQFSAEWIEFETRGPGEAARVERREVFDLIGPAARAAKTWPAAEKLEGQRLDRALALFGRTEVLILGCGPSDEYFQDMLAGHVLSQRQSVVKMLDDAAAEKTVDAIDDMSKVSLIPGELYALPVLRQVWNRHAAEVFIARPNVYCYRTRPYRDERGNLMIREGLDVVDNAVEVRSGADRAAVRLEQGVLDTNLEAVLIPGAQAGHTNAADRFAAALDEGVAWVTLRGGDDVGKLASLDWSADAKARAAEELRAGHVLVAPPKAGGGAGEVWWRVDPKTGQALGMSGRGEGASMTEYALILWALFDGVHNAMGCGAFNGTSSAAKSWACVGCAAAVAAITIAGGFALKAVAAEGAAASAYAKAGAPAAGTAGHIVGAGCNAISRWAE